MPTLLEAQEKVRELSTKALEVTQSKTMTGTEMKEALDKIEPDIHTWEAEVKNLKYVADQREKFLRTTAQGEQQGKATGDEEARPNEGGAQRQRRKSMGEQFTDSAQYKALMKNWNGRGQQWSTGAVETKAPSDASTVWEGMPSTTPAGSAGALVATPTVLPGYVDVRFPQLVVADLIPQGEASTPLIRFLQEDPSTINIGAAEVAEAGTYPEATIKFTKADAAMTKIGVALPLTDETLEDVNQIQSYINGRLQLFVRQREQYQLLNANGTSPNMSGLITQATATTVPVAGGNGFPLSDNQMDAIYRQITNIRMTAFMEPDGVVMDPVSWQDITLAKTALGQYYANGPFMSQGAYPTLWGLPTVQTTAMNGQASNGLPNSASAQQALVGCFQQCAQIFRRGGLTVEASNSHGTLFLQGTVMLRGEQREVLIVYRPAAFGLVTGL
ncbi:MAG: phage major capsid protein [Actinocrinis sp.]